MKRLQVVILGMASALFGVSSYAASIDFVLGGGSTATVDDSNVEGGSLAAVVNPDLDGTAFSLAPGESKEVSFFDLVFDCGQMICGGPATVGATLDFASPVASATGAASGIGFSLLGVLTAGVLNWTTQPGILSTAAGDFSVVFENLAGFSMGPGLTVHATITALSAAVSPIPLPAAAWLFLTALLTLAGINSRKRRGTQPLPAY